MIKKNIFIGWCLVLLCLVSCSPKSEYTHALPKDASLVASFDLKMMADKAQLKGKEGQQLTDKFIALVKGGLEGEAARLIEKIVNKPSESGLNLADRVYLFATPHANAIGILIKVESEGKLEDLLEALGEQQICSDIQEESGCRWVQMGQSLCTFNNGTFLWMKNRSGDVDNIKGTAFMLMRQQEDDGFVSMSDFARLKEVNSEIASVIDISILPDCLTNPLRMGLSGDIRLQDIKYLVTTDFEQGQMKVTFNSLSSNQKVQKLYQDMNQIMSVLKGKYMDYFPASTLAWWGGRMQGKDVFHMLSQNPTLRHRLLNPELPIDMQRIFSSIEGDFAVGYTSMLSDEFLLYADVTNDDFLSTFEELRPLLALTGGQVQLFDTAENQYALKTMEGIYWFGVKNGFLYLTNRRELAEEAGRTYGVSVGTRPWASDAKNSRMYASINFIRLSADIKARPYLFSFLGSQQLSSTLKIMAGEYEYVNVGISDCTQGQIYFVMKNKKMNPLQSMIQMINQM